MWPWGHLAFGLLSYFVFLRLRGRQMVPPAVLLALALGTQFPDLVDKPLAWSFHLLPNGRSLAHSIFTFALLSTVLYWLGSRYGRTSEVSAFSFGYASHIVGDVFSPLMDGSLYYASFFLWPLVPAVDYGEEVAFVERFRGLELTPSIAIQGGLLALGVAWYLLARRRASKSATADR